MGYDRFTLIELDREQHSVSARSPLFCFYRFEMTYMLGLALSCCSSEFCYSHHVKKLSQLDNVRHNSQLPQLSQEKEKPTLRQLIVVSC